MPIAFLFVGRISFYFFRCCCSLEEMLYAFFLYDKCLTDDEEFICHWHKIEHGREAKKKNRQQKHKWKTTQKREKNVEYKREATT